MSETCSVDAACTTGCTTTCGTNADCLKYCNTVKCKAHCMSLACKKGCREAGCAVDCSVEASSFDSLKTQLGTAAPILYYSYVYQELCGNGAKDNNEECDDGVQNPP